MRVLIAEKLSPHKYKTPEGYLICQDAILARTGKQTYLNREVYGDSIDNPDKEIEIDRPEAEVFSDKTLASFENKPVTIEHPDEDVNIDNHNFYSVGFVRDIKRGIDNGKPVMIGTLVVTNPDAVADIENGKLLELSCGYDCDIVDNAQTNIRGNHVALCEHGRAGNARIIDSTTSFRKNMIKGEKSMKDAEQTFKVLATVPGDYDDEPGFNIIFNVKANSENEAIIKAKKYAEKTPAYKFAWDFRIAKPNQRTRIEHNVDSKFKDFDDTTKNIRVVKEFIEQNGNKFDKRKDADAILEYIKKRTGIANADYGDVLYIIKEYTRAEITDSVKDMTNDAEDLSGLYKNDDGDVIKVTRHGFSYDVQFGEDTIFNTGWSYPRSYDSNHLQRYIRQNRLTKVSSLKYLTDSVKDAKYVIMHPRKNLYLTVGAKTWSDESDPMIKKFDSEKEAEEYAKKNTSDFRIAVFDSVKDMIDCDTNDEQVKDDEKTILFELLTKYGFKILRQGKTWSGRTHIEFVGDFFDEDDRLRVFSEAKKKIDKLDSEAERAGLRMTFNIGLGRDRVVGSIDSEPMRDSTYSEVTNELKSELKDENLFAQKALKAIKTLKMIK